VGGGDSGEVEVGEVARRREDARGDTGREASAVGEVEFDGMRGRCFFEKILRK
jgi:hypothetical protein